MREWMDITLPLAESLPPWPGDRPFLRDIRARIGEGGSSHNQSALSMSAHAGTHLDAPLHFIKDGKAIDEVDTALLIGPAYVLDMTGSASHIEACDLEGRLPAGVLRLLVRTRNSALLGDGRFHEDFIAFSATAAHFLIDSGVRLLGLDYYSIGPYGATSETHRAFLGVPGTAALENVDLSKAREGWYDLVCLPLRVAGGEGSPARVLIRKREDRPHEEI